MNDKTETTDIEPLSEGPLVARDGYVSGAVKILPDILFILSLSASLPY